MRTLELRRPANLALLALCAAAIAWISLTDVLSTEAGLPRAALLALVFLAIRLLFMKNIPSPTPSGAIVMAIGIFVNGALFYFEPQGGRVGHALALILFLLLLFIAASYLADAIQGRAFERHFANPIAGFAVGTWVAGTSVCCIALSQRLPTWRPFVQILVIGNVLLWLYFAYRSVRNFALLSRTDAGSRVHGVLLLSTVSTQSLVIVWKAAFGGSAAYRAAAPWIILIGVAFYAASFALIVRRYLRERGSFDLDRSWFNTNCIIHGAMSITGLASAVSGVVSPDLQLSIWIWVLFWFIMVEAIEIGRAVKRVREQGWVRGLFVYDPTQWSRNFTFGMLYAFTTNFDIGRTAASGTFLVPLRTLLLSLFPWVVLALLLAETALFLRDRLSSASGSSLAAKRT
ncbi:SLAC1 family transporter [Salinispira pacifica]